MAKVNRAKLRKSLIEQLCGSRKPPAHYSDLVDDYLNLWETKELLQADIKEKGISYETMSAAGVKILKQNPSTKEIVMVNRQMLTILKELGLTTEKLVSHKDDDDEL